MPVYKKQDICTLSETGIKCDSSSCHMRGSLIIIDELLSKSLLFITDHRTNIVCPGEAFQELVWGSEKAFLWSFPGFLVGKRLHCLMTADRISYIDEELIATQGITINVSPGKRRLEYYVSTISRFLGSDAKIFLVTREKPEHSYLNLLAGMSDKAVYYAIRNFLEEYIGDPDIVEKLSDLLISGIVSEHISSIILLSIVDGEAIKLRSSGNELFIETRTFDITYKKLGRGREVIVHDH